MLTRFLFCVSLVSHLFAFRCKDTLGTCMAVFLHLDIFEENGWMSFTMSQSAPFSGSSYLQFSSVFTFTPQGPRCCFPPCLNLRVYLCFRRKRGADYASGVSRPCYSCNTRYMHWIRSMHIASSYPRTWLNTCMWTHMLNLNRALVRMWLGGSVTHAVFFFSSVSLSRAFPFLLSAEINK